MHTLAIDTLLLHCQSGFEEEVTCRLSRFSK